MKTYFKNHRSVQLIIAFSQTEKTLLKGIAKTVEESLLEVMVSEQDWPNTNKITKQSSFFINFDSREGTISLRASLDSIPEKGRFRFQILDYEQDGSDQGDLRVSGPEVKAVYYYLSENGQAKKQTRKETKVMNISPKGLLIRCDEVIEPYKVIGLEITLPTKDRYTLRCTAKVARMALNTNGQIDLGLEFLDLDQTQQGRLSDFCQENA